MFSGSSLLFVGAYVLYQLVRGLIHYGNGYKPFGDATRIIDIERWLHVFAEPSIQAWAQNKHWLMDVADWTYLNAHYFVTIGALIFIYMRRNDSFYFVRNMFMTAMAIALIGYWLYPTAPPRLLPEWGFTDSISQFLGGWVDYGPEKALLNFYAAVPSMHVCFAVMVSWPMVRFMKHWWAKIAWGLYPLWITFVVVATGNHYFTDVFLGCVDRRHRRAARASSCSLAPGQTPGRSATPPPDRAVNRDQPLAVAEQTEPPRLRPDRSGRPRPRRNGAATQALMRERLIESRLTPNAISLTGFALNIAAAALVVGRLFFLAGIAFIVGSIMDTLDGRYSRMSGKGTPFGAFLDSTLDRMEEGIVLTAVGAYFASRHNEVAAAATVAAVLFSLMVSYTRARAEALGVACKVGLATRPVRVVILSIGLVFAKGASIGNFELLAPAVYVLAALAAVTTLQRILYVRKQLAVAP